MKADFLKYLSIGLILVAIQACWQNNSKVQTTLQVTETAGNEETQIIVMLKEFYIQYITECDKIPANAQNIIALKDKYFTKELVKRLDEAELDYDPILNAQDCDKDWIKTLEITPFPSQKDSYEVCYLNGETCIRLSVIKRDGIYLIANIQGLTAASVLGIKQQLSNIEWVGNYSITIDYGELDDLSKMIIQYDITVKQDSCIFSGMGYKTYFTDLCKMQENGDDLYLMYPNSIDGDGFTDHSAIDTIAILNKSGQQYYITSPVIADENWEYNNKLPLNKISNSETKSEWDTATEAAIISANVGNSKLQCKTITFSNPKNKQKKNLWQNFVTGNLEFERINSEEHVCFVNDCEDIIYSPDSSVFLIREVLFPEEKESYDYMEAPFVAFNNRTQNYAMYVNITDYHIRFFSRPDKGEFINGHDCLFDGNTYFLVNDYFKKRIGKKVEVYGF